MEQEVARDGLPGMPSWFPPGWTTFLTDAIFSQKGVIMFLQSLPTQDWGDHEVELLLSEAFLLNSVWHNAQSHFSGR